MSDAERDRYIHAVYNPGSSYWVLMGGAEHYYLFEQNLEMQEHTWFWTVPKDAQVGDCCFVYMCAPVSRIVGYVRIRNKPFYNVGMFDNKKMKNQWCAEVGYVVFLFQRPELTIRGLRAAFFDWGWLRYPRNKTRIPESVIQPFLELIRSSSIQYLGPTDPKSLTGRRGRARR